jgi:transcriptional regulator with XRE-family HTH domain
VQAPAWDPQRVSELVSELMAETGLSQRGVGRLGDFSESQTGRWLRKEARPDHDTIQRLAAAISDRYPEHAVLAGRLIAAAGYAGTVTDMRPAVVRRHWNDPDVRKLWGLSVSQDQRVVLIEALLRLRGDDGSGPVPAAFDEP